MSDTGSRVSDPIAPAAGAGSADLRASASSFIVLVVVELAPFLVRSSRLAMDELGEGGAQIGGELERVLIAHPPDLFFSARSTTKSSIGGTSGFTRLGAGGWTLTTLWKICGVSSPENSFVWVSISYRTTPREKMSER